MSISEEYGAFNYVDTIITNPDKTLQTKRSNGAVREMDPLSGEASLSDCFAFLLKRGLLYKDIIFFLLELTPFQKGISMQGHRVCVHFKKGRKQLQSIPDRRLNSHK